MTSVLAVLLGVAAAASAPAQQKKPKPPCCFNHPQFAGTCSVEPTGSESCSSVLGYLNNPNATGKSYCNSTTTRGGWKSVSCKPAH